MSESPDVDSSFDRVGEGIDTIDIGSIRAQFASADVSRHLASFYRTRDEQLSIAAAYVANGIERDERAFYITDENDPQSVATALEATGLDVEALRADGQLVLRSSASVYGCDTFEPEEAANALAESAQSAVEDGYERLRVAGENTWAFEIDCALDRIVEFERDFDEKCPHLPVIALCQYNLDQFADSVVGRALQMHEQVVYRGRLCENPYYVQPTGATADGDPLSNAELLLEQMRDIDQFKHDIEDREQRLSVVNRVLRHNLRNEINIIQGRLDWLRSQDAFAGNDDIGDHLNTVDEAADRLVNLSERARYVDRTLETVDRGRIDLDGCLTSVVDRVEGQVPGLTVSTEMSPSDVVVADGAVRVALRELLSAASEATTDPTLSVSVETDERHGTATIEVAAEKPFVPAATRSALRSETEASLRHTAGLGLWVVQWVTEALNGTLDIPGGGAADRVWLTVPIVSSNPTTE